MPMADAPQELANADSCKHGLAAGDAARSERPDWTIDQRQTKLLPERACDEFVAGMRSLPTC